MFPLHILGHFYFKVYVNVFVIRANIGRIRNATATFIVAVK